VQILSKKENERERESAKKEVEKVQRDVRSRYIGYQRTCGHIKSRKYDEKGKDGFTSNESRA
jgi:hypothetical protein